MRTFYRLAVSAILLVGASFISAPAMACHDNGHESGCETTAGGIPLAPVPHDMVAPLAAHTGTVLSLAADELRNPRLTGVQRKEFLMVFDMTIRAYRATWWGMSPGEWLNMGDAVTTDTNPWHRPTHNAARGTYDLAMRMARFDGTNAEVMTMQNTLNEATANRMGTCLYSLLAFNTANPVEADWSHQQDFLDKVHEWSIRTILFLVIAGFGTFQLRFLFRRLKAPFPETASNRA
jgi:hypothetical protein